MESQDVLKIHGALRRYCTSRALATLRYATLDTRGAIPPQLAVYF